MSATETELKPAWADSDKRLGRIGQGADLELHVKETKVEGQTFINIRDFVPSARQYGKGTLIRKNDLPALLEILNQYADDQWGRSGRPTAGQQSLSGME